MTRSSSKAFKSKIKASTPATVSSREKSNILRADLHMHTCHSADSLSSVEDVLSAAVKKNLNAIAITDHNEIKGAFEAEALARKLKLPLQVIVGEEVGTDKGDLLVYFLKRKIMPGPLARVLKEVKQQGAVCCAAHPYDFARHGIHLEKLPPSELAAIDAIEAFNARVTLPFQNESALSFSQKKKKPVLAGSDAHHPSEIGGAYAEFECASRLDKRSLLSALRTLHGLLASPHVHLFSRYAVLKKKISARFK